MKGPGILWMLQTAAGLSMAGPMFVVGFDLLRSGQYVAGAGFLALGAIALYFPTYLMNRIGGPRTWIRRRLNRGGDTDGGDGADVRIDADEALDRDGEPGESSESNEARRDRVPILDRFRGRER